MDCAFLFCLFSCDLMILLFHNVVLFYAGKNIYKQEHNNIEKTNLSYHEAIPQWKFSKHLEMLSFHYCP